MSISHYNHDIHSSISSVWMYDLWMEMCIASHHLEFPKIVKKNSFRSLMFWILAKRTKDDKVSLKYWIFHLKCVWHTIFVKKKKKEKREKKNWISKRSRFGHCLVPLVNIGSWNIRVTLENMSSFRDHSSSAAALFHREIYEDAAAFRISISVA